MEAVKSHSPGVGYGEKLPSPPHQRKVDHFLQPECWLLRLSLLLYFLSTVELPAGKGKKYLVGLAESISQNHGNWLLLVCITISTMWDDGCFFPFILMNSGKHLSNWLTTLLQKLLMADIVKMAVFVFQLLRLAL